MKTKTIMPLGARGFLVAAGAVAVFASLVMFAYADVATPVSVSVRNSSGTTLSAATIGSTVYANTVVASSSTTTIPTGNVDFYSYSNTSCVGSPTLQSGVALASGTATSSGTVIGASGLSFRVHYSGQGTFEAGESTCVAVTATAVSPTIVGTLSTSTPVLAGTSVSESAVLSGATGNAGGSATYRVFSNNSCTTLWQGAGVKTVTNTSVPTSDGVAFNFPGTYYWQVVYSGDAQNGAATSSCAALSVIATSSTPTPTPGTGSISGKVYNDLDKDRVLDSGEAGIAGVTIKLHKSNKNWWDQNGNNTAFMSVTTDSNGNYSFANLANGTYSVEEIIPAGWKQISDDFKSLTISGSNAFTDKNFANASTTVKGGNNHNDDDNGNHGDKGNNGNHFGWRNFWDRFGSLPWGQNKN
ncbi:MAG: SdrD B-like domain-containing protein [Patescibacteria group bacterium]